MQILDGKIVSQAVKDELKIKVDDLLNSRQETTSPGSSAGGQQWRQ
ncbi:MAG: hypothetical protein V9E88_17820 [Ferruginibacter sp.]